MNLYLRLKTSLKSGTVDKGIFINGENIILD